MAEPEKEKCRVITNSKTNCKWDAVQDGMCTKHFNLSLKPKKEVKFYIPDRSKIPNRENGLCKEYVRGGKQCTHYATTEGLCEFHYKRKDIPKKEKICKYEDKDRCIALIEKMLRDVHSKEKKVKKDVLCITGSSWKKKVNHCIR